MVNVDFKFDFASALAKEYHDSEIYQSIAYIAKDIDANNPISIETAIRELIKINSTVLANVLENYNQELLNEIEL